MNLDLRQNVRASLNTQVIIQGSDRSGKGFQVTGESVDFSRRGLGLVLSEDLVSPGAVVTVSVPGKFQTNAVVQWSRRDEATGKTRLGVQMMDKKASVGIRVAASLLLCLALFGQISFARSRGASGYQAKNACTMSLAHMKGVLESKLGQWTVVSETEKAFLHAQHQQLSCSEYTKVYEKSNFYPDQNKRSAVSRWHWNQYHSKDAATRAAAVENAEATLAGGN